MLRHLCFDVSLEFLVEERYSIVLSRRGFINIVMDGRGFTDIVMDGHLGRKFVSTS